MCRLLGYVAGRATSIEEILGPEGLAEFTALTTVHGDGWGMAWRDDDGTHTTTSPHSAAVDPEYDDLVHRRLGAAGMVHLRWATGGLPVRVENSHPFFEGEYAFAHNGHVAPMAELEALLTPGTRARLVGDTDSERYFRFVLQCIDECGDEATGVTEALATLIRTFPSSSLNALLLTGRKIFAIHVNSRADSPLRALREMFDDREEIPPRHETDYFAMDYQVTDDCIAIVSSGLRQPGWTPIPDDLAVMVDLETREVRELDPVAEMVDEVEATTAEDPRRP